ncbi:hypothetical protein CEXT_40161 [Caerostris extrusa]|uniref:Uncharacterized protein n=1 Tax=Caerostris extrusa TaxID=172846 RepID=A0AAV4MRM6_CAEEX|nr:hypothetical protein CEXT_40161 [Caerostris extrusa]
MVDCDFREGLGGPLFGISASLSSRIPSQIKLHPLQNTIVFTGLTKQTHLNPHAKLNAKISSFRALLGDKRRLKLKSAEAQNEMSQIRKIWDIRKRIC